MNNFRTGLLMAAMTGLLGVCGYLIGGEVMMLIAIAFAGVGNFIAYWNADKIVLRIYGAKPVDRKTAPDFYGLVEDLAKRANLPMPKVFIIPNDQPNAFATGRNPENAAVAATTGLLQNLSRNEIAGVMAHELAHVERRDTLVMTITATLAGAISVLSNMAMFSMFFGGNDRNNPMGAIGILLMMVLGPLAAVLVQTAISRTREYGADARGAEICGNPEWLASALANLHNASRRIDNNAAERNPATAHMFIVNPLHGHAIDGLFSTHPPMEKRIAALRAMTNSGGGASFRREDAQSSKSTTSPRSGIRPWRTGRNNSPWT